MVQEKSLNSNNEVYFSNSKKISVSIDDRVKDVINKKEDSVEFIQNETSTITKIQTTINAIEPGKTIKIGGEDVLIDAIREDLVQNLEFANRFNLFKRDVIVNCLDDQRANLESSKVSFRDDPVKIKLAKNLITDIEGVGIEKARKLAKVDIMTEADFYLSAKTEHDRQKLSQAVDISRDEVDEIYSKVDLSRLSDVGTEYSILLYKSGVKSVEDLSTQDAITLCEKIVEVNEKNNLTQRTPGMDLVKRWVMESKNLIKHDKI